MLVLQVYVGAESFSIQSKCVLELVSRVSFQKVFHSPKFFLGMMNFRGQLIPVIDLCQLVAGRPCDNKLHSRVVILNYSTKDQENLIFACLAEKVTQTVNVDEASFSQEYTSTQSIPYIDKTYSGPKNFLQFLSLEYLAKKILEIREK
jgi:chemotaxis-related protein WspB